MAEHDKVNILLVDDQPAKLLSYQVILKELGENLIQANSATEAFQHLLKTDVALVLMDVCMPDLDGFELAAMIRGHPRFQNTAIIFISAIHLTETDHLRGYEMGAVDYVPVPVVPELLRAKVKVFAELYRKGRELEQLNRELEQRVAARTAELEASTARLTESERRRSLALAAGRMGSWEWDVASASFHWDEGQHGIFGVDPATFVPTPASLRALIHPGDLPALEDAYGRASSMESTFQTEFRVQRPDGSTRFCFGAGACTFDASGVIARISGVTVDISERKQAEEHQMLLAREVDHRARNALALVQAIVRLTKASSIETYVGAVEGRIKALSQVHTLLSESRWQGADVERLVAEELAPYRVGDSRKVKMSGPRALLAPEKAQTLALVLHELATNAAKYGALSTLAGEVHVDWEVQQGSLTLQWTESGGPPVAMPTSKGFGTRIVNSSIQHQAGGTVSLDWNPLGLRCRLTFPAGMREAASSQALPAEAKSNQATAKEETPGQVSGQNGRQGASPGQTSSDKHHAGTNGVASVRRLLLVEDEALVGMMMRDALDDIGFDVTGPVGSLADARIAAVADGIDGAVLDINLAGEMVFPVADLLRDRGVPFIFVTGYDPESIDPKFAGIPVLQKPVSRDALERVLHDNVGPAVRAEANQPPIEAA
ncbi:MAG: two-component response regulator [Xanthobacteraceae bacterium]|nr:two-component response regulator [Xanthobacteraceae bacterium]